MYLVLLTLSVKRLALNHCFAFFNSTFADKIKDSISGEDIRKLVSSPNKFVKKLVASGKSLMYTYIKEQKGLD